jgi:hypothetical protein
MDPVSAVTTAWTIAKTAGGISKKLFEFEKSLYTWIRPRGPLSLSSDYLRIVPRSG